MANAQVDDSSTCSNIMFTQLCIDGDCGGYPATQNYAQCLYFANGNIVPSESFPPTLTTVEGDVPGLYTYYDTSLEMEVIVEECKSRCYQSHEENPDLYSAFFMVSLDRQCTCRKASEGCEISSRSNNNWQAYTTACADDPCVTLSDPAQYIDAQCCDCS